MNEIQNIDYLFYQNFTAVYEYIFLCLNRKDAIFQQISENYIDFSVSIETVVEYNALLRYTLGIELYECYIDMDTFRQALQVISGKFQGALHNFMIFFEDVQELSFYQMIHLDLMLLRSYNLDFGILYKALQSVGYLNQSFLAIADPVTFSNGFQVYAYRDMFFVQRATEPAAHVQYLLVAYPAKSEPNTGAYDYMFNVLSATPLHTAAQLPDNDYNYAPFATILAKTEQTKYSEVLISSNARPLSVRISSQYSAMIDNFASNKLKLLVQGGKHYVAFPFIFEATLINGTQIYQIHKPSNLRINDLEFDSAVAAFEPAIRFCEMLYDSYFSGFMLSNKIYASESEECQIIPDADGPSGYFYIYIANQRFYAARAGELYFLDVGARITYSGGEFKFTFYQSDIVNMQFYLPMDYFVEAYAYFASEINGGEVSITAIYESSVFECTIEQAFRYSFSNYYRVLSLRIHEREEIQGELSFIPPTWDYTPDLVFEQVSVPLFTPPVRSAYWSFTPNSHYSQPCIGNGEISYDPTLSFYAPQQQSYYMSPPRQPRAKIQVSLVSSVADQELSQIQPIPYVDPRAFTIKGVNGYVRYHFPSYNIAIVAFYDPYHRDDQWTHSLAVWRVPSTLYAKVCRYAYYVLPDGREDLYFARAKLICDVYPLEANSGIYVVDYAEFIDYIDPSTECSKERLVEGSVYWQEIDKEKRYDNTFGFVRLASGHERHFFCKRRASLLGHLVEISLYENKQHPNSCELLRSLQQPPDKQRWLYGRVIDVFAEIPVELENILKKSFRTTLTHPGAGKQLVNGMVMAEPFQGTHVDICFFRLVYPDFIIQQLKPGVAVYFTLKDYALHKVIDEAKYQIPVEMLNDLLQCRQLKKQYRIQQKEQGNSAKLSCWAVDNIAICAEIYQGDFISCVDKNCYGIKPEALFFARYKQIIQQTRDSIIYVPRPVIYYNAQQQLIKEGERFRFNIYFTFNDQKSAFLPEANYICRIQQDVLCQKIMGRIHKIKFYRYFLYIFKPDYCDNAADSLMQCISDQIIPLTSCFMIKSSCFYLLQNDVINNLYKCSQYSKIRKVFNDLVNGLIPVVLKSVSLGLISTVGFEEQQALRQLEWCRYADELTVKLDVFYQLEEDDESEAPYFVQDDFLKY